MSESKLDNTGLGITKTFMERLQNKNSLFSSAAKKFVNSTEDELANFLYDNKSQKQILHLISGGHNLIIKALDGKRLIYNSKKTFKSHIDQDFVNLGLNKTGIVTTETPVQVHEMVGDGTFTEIFGSIPGNWDQKWLSQNQIIDFCETLPNWLRQDKYATMFLIKKDENKPVYEVNLQDNLAVVHVGVGPGGLRVLVRRLGRDDVFFGEYRHRVVSPQLIPLVS
jgi:hypothetical protein